MNKMKSKKVSLLTLSLVFTFIITLLFYVQSIRVIDKTIHEKIYNVLNYNSMIIENKVENTELLSHELATIISSTLPYEDVENNPIAMEKYKNNIDTLIIEIIKSFNAKTGWVVFDTNVIKDSGTLSYSKQGEAYIREAEYDVRKSKYAEQEWWVVAEQNGTSWSTPYYWAPWEATIITYSEQVIVDENLVAMSGSDLYFNEIADQLNNAKLYKSGYMTLLNAENKVIYDRNKDYIGKDYSTLNNNQYKPFIDIVKTDKEINIIDDMPNNTNNIFAYIKLDNGWILLTNLTKKEIFNDINQLNIVLIIIILSLILFSYYGSKIINKKV